MSAVPFGHSMKWYVAELIVACRVGRRRAALWDTQLVAIHAHNSHDAHTQAIKFGRKQNHAYDNASGEKVRWRFEGLGDLRELLAKSIRSGTELHSHLSRETPPNIRPKNKLTVFWAERNLRKKAGSLLSDDLRPFAPR